jgi:phytoene dehydrogenase-like protein
MSVFDHIIVGSSPVSLCFAALLAMNGKRVCLLEKQDRLGGAWALGDVLGLKAVETSPHVFLPDSEAYALLDACLDSRFRHLDIQPALNTRSIFPPFKTTRQPISDAQRYKRQIALADLRTSSLLRPRQLLRRVKRLRRAYLSSGKAEVAHSVVAYPENGLVGMFERAEKKLVSAGVNLRTGAHVTQVDFDAAQCRVTLQSQGTLAGKKLWLNRHVELDAIQGLGKTLPLKRKTRTSQHFVLIVRHIQSRGFVQFTPPSPLLFVNDVTDYCERQSLSPGERVFCARTGVGHELSAEQVFAHLLEVGYFAKDAVLLRRHVEQRHVSKIDPDCIEAVKTNFKNHVDFLLADDLSLMSSIANLRMSLPA